MADMLHFCTYEDRPANTVGLKLLILSFDRFSSGSLLTIFLPKPDTNLEQWAAGKTSRICFKVSKSTSTGWAVKADMLLSLMENTGDDDSYIWLDADILIIRKFEHVFANLPKDLIITSQDFYEPFKKDSGKSALWGWQVSRDLKCTVNSSVIRISQHHRELLVAWRDMLQSPRFVQEQKKHYKERISQLYSDQDLLETLLCSDGPGDFDKLAFDYLRTGEDIVHEHHYYSYRFKHRLMNALGLGHPVFVHCQCAKPWMNLQEIDADVVAVMAYVRASVRWRNQLDEDVESWMDRSTSLSRWAKRLSFDNIHAQGLALWMRDRWRRRRVRRPVRQPVESQVS